MTERAYYQLSLVLPFALGALWTSLSPDAPLRVFVLWFALAPYGIFALFLVVWFTEQPTHRIRTVLLLSPLVFAGGLSALAFPIVALVFNASVGETVLTVGLLCLVVGYVCVGFAFALVVLLRAVGMVRRDSGSPPSPTDEVRLAP